jgi:hypothetical protein
VPSLEMLGPSEKPVIAATRRERPQGASSVARVPRSMLTRRGSCRFERGSEEQQSEQTHRKGLSFHQDDVPFTAAVRCANIPFWRAECPSSLCRFDILGERNGEEGTACDGRPGLH